MKLIQLQEQILKDTPLQHDVTSILSYIEDGKEIEYTVKRGREENELCLKLQRRGEDVYATSSYFVGVDWIKENEVGVQVSPKMNDGYEIDYVRMLNDALCEKENFEHLKDLITIKFDKPSIRITQKQDLLSIFLITEYLNLLHRIVKRGLKKSYIIVEDNLHNKVKGRVLVAKNTRKNLMRGKMTDNICSYQVYGVDSPENQILKKALIFCVKQLDIYNYALDIRYLREMVRLISPHFDKVSDIVNVSRIKSFNANPIYKDYKQAVDFAQLLLKRYSYNITLVGKMEIDTPPFWIDMSKLFELYSFHHLRRVFTHKNEVRYHVKAHYQELDYLLNPVHWPEPYVIDAKYKPRYKNVGGVSKEDAREVAGYSRLSSVYERLGLNAEISPPIKCLIIYPDQDKEEGFTFNRYEEPVFDRVSGYVRFYKQGIRLPII
jgi:5-methylcytosine-specific restriction enzyme subunit McrC